MDDTQRPRRLFFADLFTLLLLSTATLLPGQQARADELLMKDGSRLIGEVVKRENDTLEYKTSYAGVIKVKWDEVVELHADKPMQLMLDDEESVVTAKHIKSSEEGLILYDDIEPDLSEPSLAQDELAYINPAPWRTGEGYKLDGHINFALSRERGNTDKDELDVDGDLIWRFKDDRITMFGELERDRSNNQKTKDKWKMDNSYDHFLTKKWFVGAYLGFEHDRFADLNLRSIIGPKVGYQWFEGKDMNLSTAAGPLYTDEDFDTDPDDDYIALGWGIDFDKFLFREIMQFYHRQTGLWSMDDSSDVVWNTWTGLRFPLIWRLVASTEMRVEYDSGAAENTDDTDTTYTLKIGYQW
jgi:putative salt-induced outer membrane protein YdiY